MTPETLVETAKSTENKEKVTLIIRGDERASHINDTTILNIVETLTRGGAQGQYVLKVQTAHPPHPQTIHDLLVGPRLAQGKCKIFVCLPDVLMECVIGPTRFQQNLPDTHTLLVTHFLEMKHEELPASSWGGSEKMRLVVQKLLNQHGKKPFLSTEVYDLGHKYFNGRGLSGFIGNLYRNGALIRVSQTETRVAATSDSLPTQERAKKKTVPQKMAGDKPRDEKLIDALRLTHGADAFSVDALKTEIKKLAPHWYNNKAALGGYIAGLRTRKILRVVGDGGERQFIIPARRGRPSGRKNTSGTPPIPSLAENLRVALVEYEESLKQREKLQKELAVIEKKILAFEEKVRPALK